MAIGGACCERATDLGRRVKTQAVECKNRAVGRLRVSAFVRPNKNGKNVSDRTRRVWRVVRATRIG